MKKLLLVLVLLLFGCIGDANATESNGWVYAKRIKVRVHRMVYYYYIDYENKICIADYNNFILLTDEQCNRLIERYIR